MNLLQHTRSITLSLLLFGSLSVTNSAPAFGITPLLAALLGGFFTLQHVSPTVDWLTRNAVVGLKLRFDDPLCDDTNHVFLPQQDFDPIKYAQHCSTCPRTYMQFGVGVLSVAGAVLSYKVCSALLNFLEKEDEKSTETKEPDSKPKKQDKKTN